MPRPDGTRGHRCGSSTFVPNSRLCGHVASGNVIALDVRDPEKYLRNIAYTCETPRPKPKVVVVNFPHNPLPP